MCGWLNVLWYVTRKQNCNYSTTNKLNLDILRLLVIVLVVNARLLVLLVLGDQVVHVGLRLGELHLVHALASVPVEESLNSNKH